MRTFRTVPILLAVMLAAACTSSTEPLPDPIQHAEAWSNPPVPTGWQLVRVNGHTVAPWLIAAAYRFQNAASDTVRTRYVPQEGYACFYPSGDWTWVRTIASQWETQRPDPNNSPPGGYFAANGVAIGAPYQATLVATEIRAGQFVELSAIATKSGGRLFVTIAHEAGAVYEFVNAGQVGSDNCALARR